MKTRRETDSMGEVAIPASALYGASTQRAVENFAISKQALPRPYIRALGRLKRACALANVDLGTLDATLGYAIAEAAKEVSEGQHDEHFPVDVFQTGSGTSTNMNANEVIANRCAQLLGFPMGRKHPVHPNDHVNRSQSSNDIMPSALHVSVALALRDELIPACERLEAALQKKARKWKHAKKLGRTHMMDAVPMTLGDEFSGYARQLSKAKSRCERGIQCLRELAVGGTAVGTGLNADTSFGKLVCRILEEDTGIAFREAKNHFEAQASRDDIVEVAGHLSANSAAFSKIANDIRLLGSGPRAGLAELKLPAVQPGSSIMPGKVNPVMCEMMVQVSHDTIGRCQTATRCGQDGQLELNATIPLLAHSLLTTIERQANAARTFAERCIESLEANVDRCEANAKNTLNLATALTPHIGYDKAAKVAKHAAQKDLSIEEAAKELDILDPQTLSEILDPLALASQTNPVLTEQ